MSLGPAIASTQAANGDVRLVVAYDRAGGIGRQGRLPWHLPADLARFKSLTLGQTVLMGRKTAESIGRALPGRLNLVLTRLPTPPFADQRVVGSIDHALALAGAEPLFVIGGSEVYRALEPRARLIHATEVDALVEGCDAWFEPPDSAHFDAIEVGAHRADSAHAWAFRFVDYHRRPL